MGDHLELALTTFHDALELAAPSSPALDADAARAACRARFDELEARLGTRHDDVTAPSPVVAAGDDRLRRARALVDESWSRARAPVVASSRATRRGSRPRSSRRRWPTS